MNIAFTFHILDRSLEIEKNYLASSYREIPVLMDYSYYVQNYKISLTLGTYSFTVTVLFPHLEVPQKQ